MIYPYSFQQAEKEVIFTVYGENQALSFAAPINKLTKVNQTFLTREVIKGLVQEFNELSRNRQQIPLPAKPAEGQLLLEVPFYIQLKVLFSNKFHQKDLKKMEFATQHNINLPQFMRLFDFSIKQEFSTFEKMFKLLGYSLVLKIKAR